MNQEEKFLRKELRRFRAAATTLQWVAMDEALYSVVPEFQAEAIIEGIGYWLPARLLVRTLLATGELQLKDEVCPHCGYILTEEEQWEETIEKAEKILKEKFDPVEITHEVTMPLVKNWLENIECKMVEEGYRLPKWGRPKWLREMEKGKLPE